MNAAPQKQTGAYVHALPDAESAMGIFYVGKGSLRRMRNFTSRGPEHKDIVSTHGEANILVGFIQCSSQEIAYELEAGLIKQLRRQRIPLVNKTLGGTGPTGYIPSVETRNKISAAKRGDRNPMRRPEVAAKVSANSRSRDADVKARTSATRSRPEIRLKTSLAQQQAWADQGVRERRISGMNRPEIKAAQSARFSSNNPSCLPGVKVIRSSQSKVRWASDGYREKMRESLRSAWHEDRRHQLSLCNPSHNPDTNVKKSEALKGYRWPVLTCSNCSQTGIGNIMKKWHFDRCRKSGVNHAAIS